MAGLQVPGIGSGLDIEGMSKGLANAEIFGPMDNAVKAGNKIDSRISALSQITAGLESFKGTISRLHNASSTDNKLTYNAESKIVTINSNGRAMDGDYDVEVNQIASNHRLMTSVYGEDEVFSGSMMITVDGSSSSLSIEDNSSIYSLANQINDSMDDISAVVINNGSGNVLSISSRVDGIDGVMKITSLDNSTSTNTNMSKINFDVASTTNLLTEVNAAKNAIMKINGVSVESSGNNFDDAISGLEISINPETAVDNLNAKQNFKIEKDDSAILTSLKAFVGNFNGIMDGLKDLQKYDQSTGTAGAFNGDSDVRQLSTELAMAMVNVVDSGSSKYNTLYSIGVRSLEAGRYKVDEDIFAEALEDDRSSVLNLIKNGFSTNNTNIVVDAEDADILDAFSEEITIKSKPRPSEVGMDKAIEGNPLSTPVTITSGLSLLYNGTLLASGLGEGGDSLSFTNYADLLDQINQDLVAKGIPVEGALNYTNTPPSTSYLTSMLFTQNNVSEGILSIDTASMLSGFSANLGIASAPGVLSYQNNDYDYYSDFDLPDIDASIEISVEKIKDNESAIISLNKGYAYRLDSIINKFMDEDGIFDIKEDSLDASKTRIDETITGLEEDLVTIEERYLKQFQALDLQLVRLKTQSDTLDGQLKQIAANSSFD